jgi:hypothetical protein
LNLFQKSLEEEIPMPGLQKTPPGQRRLFRIARALRLAVLRLEEVAIAVAGDVEGMSPRTDPGLLPALQRSAAAPHRAEEGDHEGEYLAPRRS